MSGVLERICADKRIEAGQRLQDVGLETIKARAASAPPPRGFMAAIRREKDAGRPALIAEIKRASPSQGLIRTDFAPYALAKAYEQAGATCLSVLTDTPDFMGDDVHLQEARDAASLPLLRKDFMLIPYQIYESRALGADCVLLIMAALADDDAASLYRTAQSLGMDVLVEVHDAEELARAKALGAEMIGVNNRNLKTLEVDLGTSRALISGMPRHVLAISESGIAGADDIRELSEAGYHGFLVGETLMRQENTGAAIQRLLGNKI